MKPRLRVAIAAGLVAVGFGAPLGFMWVSGKEAAEAERARLLAAPREEAQAAAERIARRVADELGRLAEREARRPYYQWQSLIVDPRGAYDGEAVVPSVLAEGPTEPLILSHFQIDDDGRVTTPEVNEAKGAPSAEPQAVARLRALSEALAGRHAGPELVAEPEVNNVAVGEPPPQQIQVAKAPPQQIQVANASKVQEQRVSNKIYLQNASAPELYEAIQEKRNKRREFGSGQVTVRVGAFEWEPLTLAGREVLMATRVVETPDAPKRQGFVVDPQRLDSLLADGSTVASLAPAGHSTSASVAVSLGELGLDRAVVVPLPDREAIAAAAEIPVSEFLLRSALLTAFALLAALAILLMVVQAERLLERRQRFAAAAAHELRTPLAGLQMYAEMLAHGLGKPERQRDYAERLAGEAARLGRVVTNVLDFTRLERKTLAVSPTTRDLAALTEDIVTRIEPSVVRAGAAIVLERPPDALMARVDPDALAQILNNLIDNAEKYARAASDRTITVTVTSGLDGPEVRVRDRGPGLPESRRLFRPFSRGAEREGPAGLGLGLALARALARAQGGALIAADREDGAELVVRFAR